MTITEAKNLEAFVVITQADRNRLSAIGDFSTELRVVGDPASVIPVTGPVHINPSATTEMRSASLMHLGGGAIAPDTRDTQGKTSAEPNYEARMVFANPGEQYFPGQRAYVRFKSQSPEPLIAQWYRWFQQLTMESTTS